MSEDRAQLNVLVPADIRNRAKENTPHGEISEKVRELLQALANKEDYDPKVEDTTGREERVKQLVESGEYPPDWNKRREETLLRDNYVCQNCGQRGGRDGTKDLIAHHIVPVENGGTHYLSNLATLCHECHDYAHGKRQF